MFCFVFFLNTGVEFLWAYWWLSGKEPTCNAAGVGSIPGSGRSPGEGNANPLQYSMLVPVTQHSDLVFLCIFK